MSSARDLLADLAVIGATIEPAGDRLILRAGNAAISAELVNRVRETKAELLTVLAPCEDRPGSASYNEKVGNLQGYGAKDKSFESHIAEWLDQHPSPSAPGRCGWCGKHETLGAVVLPFGTEPGKHAWLHAECWPAWYRGRQATAAAALRGRGGVKNWRSTP